MVRLNPDVMQFDETGTGAPSVAGAGTDTSKVTAAEVSAALDEASATLGIDRTIPNEAESNLFAPIGGELPKGDPSVADQEYFIEQGFTVGPIPEQFRRFFGNDPSVIGYKIITNPDGSQQMVVAKPQGDEDGGLGYAKFGATFTQDANGNVTITTKGGGGGGGGGTSGFGDLPPGVTIVSTYSDPTTGDVTAVLSNGTTRVLAKSGAQEAQRKSAYDLLYQQFNDLGIGGLVPELKSFIEEGISPAEFTLRLRQTDSYKKRFAANAQRINKGLRALSEAEYIAKEDAYQDIMRRYGLPESYYTRGEMGRQEGFEKLIGNDVSDVELEDRISTAQKRVLNANPEVAQALKTFYPGISQGDILAYTLDPSKAIEDIKRKVTAAEIGGAAVRAGLTTSAADAEYLQRYGVTKEQADQGYQTAAQIVPRASQLADIYKQNPYTQATAEQEIFNLPGQVEAQRQRKKLTELETSAFSGRSGMGAIARDRAGAL
jgi:hypothetical protein